MAENKTQPTQQSAADFIECVPDDIRRSDAKALCGLMSEVTGEPPVMWGGSIVGFGKYHYRYESGREGDAPLVGFSPRSKELVLYLYCHGEWSERLLARLGRHRTGKACLYVKSLADVDQDTLHELVRCSVEEIRTRYPD